MCFQKSLLYSIFIYNEINYQILLNYNRNRLLQVYLGAKNHFSYRSAHQKLIVYKNVKLKKSFLLL